MDKFKFQIIALVLSLIVGAGIGHLFTSGEKNKEIKTITEQYAKELKLENEKTLKAISERDKTIARADSARSVDSLIILNLNKKLSLREEQAKKEKEAALKLTADEKKKWIMDHYSDTN